MQLSTVEGKRYEYTLLTGIVNLTWALSASSIHTRFPDFMRSPTLLFLFQDTHYICCVSLGSSWLWQFLRLSFWWPWQLEGILLVRYYNVGCSSIEIWCLGRTDGSVGYSASSQQHGCREYPVALLIKWDGLTNPGTLSVFHLLFSFFCLLWWLISCVNLTGPRGAPLPG